MRARVLLAHFPFGNSESPDVTDWLVATTMKCSKDPRVERVGHWRIDDTPITMGRNRCLKEAIAQGFDVVCMIDSDMRPDLKLPGMKPFWDTAFNHMMGYAGPCAIGAPYCGPPPFENIYVFQWATSQTDNPNKDHSVQQYTREQAAVMSGMGRVAALPTGLFLLDMRAVALLPKGRPWFYYEWADAEQTRKASTEDVTFTRDLALAGVPLYCAWDSWAGHWKRKCVGKPRLINEDDVAVEMAEAIRSRRRSDEVLLNLPERPLPLIVPAPPVPAANGEVTRHDVRASHLDPAGADR